MAVKLGDRVRDKITGFQGIVIGVTDWLYQCRRPIVQPEEVKDGKMPDSQSFDEDQLEVLATGVIKPTIQRRAEPLQTTVQATGGLRDTPSRQSTPTR
jgi:hypothetical protein